MTTENSSRSPPHIPLFRERPERFPAPVLVADQLLLAVPRSKRGWIRSGTSLSRLLAFRADRIGSFTMHRIVTDLQDRVFHPQWRDEGNDLEDDEGGDDVVDDDERRALSLQ